MTDPDPNKNSHPPPRGYPPIHDIPSTILSPTQYQLGHARFLLACKYPPYSPEDVYQEALTKNVRIAVQRTLIRQTTLRTRAIGFDALSTDDIGLVESLAERLRERRKAKMGKMETMGLPARLAVDQETVPETEVQTRARVSKACGQLKEVDMMLSRRSKANFVYADVLKEMGYKPPKPQVPNVGEEDNDAKDYEEEEDDHDMDPIVDQRGVFVPTGKTTLDFKLWPSELTTYNADFYVLAGSPPLNLSPVIIGKPDIESLFGQGWTAKKFREERQDQDEWIVPRHYPSRSPAEMLMESLASASLEDRQGNSDPLNFVFERAMTESGIRGDAHGSSNEARAMYGGYASSNEAVYGGSESDLD